MNKWVLTLVFFVGFNVCKAQEALVNGLFSTDVNHPSVNISVPQSLQDAGDVLYQEGAKSERRGELNDALTAFGKAAFEYSNNNQLAKYANALLRMGNVHLQLRNYTEAEQVVLNAALKAYAKLGSRAGQMASYASLGKIYLAADKLTQSMWFFTQEGILARQLGNNGSHVESVIGIANVKIKKKEFKMATRDLNSAEYLAKSYKISLYNQQIKEARQLISKKQKG